MNHQLVKNKIGFVVNKKVISFNVIKGKHWSFYNKYKKSWHENIFSDIQKNNSLDYYTRVNIVSFRKRLLDHDNFVMGCKPILDALVKLGWLYDDSLDNVCATYSQEKSSNEFTMIEIW